MAISLKTLQQNYNQYVYSDNNPTHEYFNMGLFNEYTPNNTIPRTLKFNQIKQAPIIDKSDDYYLSIIRWNLQSNLPVLIPDIQIKPNNEAFTGLTDYELAFFYNIETSTQLQDTFGLVGANGNNYLGIYKSGDFGDIKKVLLNFPPDNSASVDYDNFNNGLGTSGNGSIYIISGGILKVFDKVSSTNIFTLTPVSGSLYYLVCADKTTGDFYVGSYPNLTKIMTYEQYIRTGATTWVLGNTYTSQTIKNNVSSLCVLGSNLYELSTSSNVPDFLYGLSSNKVYEVQTNSILTTGVNLISPLAYVPQGFGFCVGTDNFTYAVTYPFTASQTPFNVNNTNSLKYLYSNQSLGFIFACGTSNLFYAWNANTAPNGMAPTNQWTSFGEFTLPSSVNILTIDVNETTQQLLAVGNDNNLYITDYPVLPYEFIQAYDNFPFSGQLLGFNMTNPSAIQSSAVVTSNFPFDGINTIGLFKSSNSYFVGQVAGPTCNLLEYNIQTGSVTNTYSSLDDNLLGLTYLPSSGDFVYCNNTPNIIVRSLSNPSVVSHSFNVPIAPNGFTCFYELDSTHFVASAYGQPNIYVYEYGTINPILTINTGSNKVVDVAVNINDINNGASTLFYIQQNNTQTTPLGDQLFKIIFTNNSYTAVSGSPSLIYNEPTGRYATFLECQAGSGTLLLLDCQYPNVNQWTDRKLNTFYQAVSYNSNNKAISAYPFSSDSAGPYKCDIGNLYFNHTTSSIYKWSQVTSNIQLTSASASRDTPNLVYGLNQTNNKLYSGTIGGGSITFSQLYQYQNTYSSVLCKAIGASPSIENLIQVWSGSGAPSSSSIIAQSFVQSSVLLPLTMKTDGTNLYALYSNLNNLTTINKLNSSLVSLLTNNLNITINNGLVGYDSNNNILLSNIVDGVNSLTSINPSTLSKINTYVDPNSDYGTTTMLIFPFDYFEIITSYSQLGETTTLIFIPETINVNYEKILDYPKNKEELFNNPYFYIKYVDTFCKMINNAIKEAWQTTGGTWTKLPYIQWDSALGKLVYNQPTSTPTGTPAPTGANFYISVNQPLYNLLNTFRFKYYPTNSGNGSLYPESAECRYLLDTNILFDGTSQPGGEYVTYLQQISSVQTWTPIQSWVFSSTIIPIESQLTGQPQNLNNVDPTTSGNIYKQQAITKVLTDFIVPLNTGVEATNQNVFYTPAGEYRLVDLIGAASLNQLSLEIKWRDKYGVDHDMYLDAGASANLLVLLRKKSYNSRM